MTYKKLTFIGCKLIALFYLIRFVSFLPSDVVNIIYALRNGTGQTLISMLAMSAVIYLSILVSILLWIFADKISTLIAGKSEEPIVEMKHDYKKLQYIAFATVGLITVVSVIPQLATSIYQFRFYTSQHLLIPGDKNYITMQMKIVENVLRFVLGLWLTMGSKGLVNAINKLRTAGIPQDSQDAVEQD